MDNITDQEICLLIQELEERSLVSSNSNFDADDELECLLRFQDQIDYAIYLDNYETEARYHVIRSKEHDCWHV